MSKTAHDLGEEFLNWHEDMPLKALESQGLIEYSSGRMCYDWNYDNLKPGYKAVWTRKRNRLRAACGGDEVEAWRVLAWLSSP